MTKMTKLGFEPNTDSLLWTFILLAILHWLVGYFLDR